jgi:hypothetical protein
MFSFEGLREGSKCHKTRIVSFRLFCMEPIDDDLNTIQNFQDVAIAAIGSESPDYEVRAYSIMDSQIGRPPIYNAVWIARTTRLPAL